MMHLDSNELSAYPEEREVLVQEGLRYRVVNIAQIDIEIQIDHRSDPTPQKITEVHLENILDDYDRSWGPCKCLGFLVS